MCLSNILSRRPTREHSTLEKCSACKSPTQQMHTQTVNLTRSLLQEFDKALAHTHADSHNYSLVDSLCCLPKSSGFGQTDMQHWHTYSLRDLTDRVQLASHGFSKWNRCARDFDLGEYQMGWGSGGCQLPIFGNSTCVWDTISAGSTY